MTEVIINDARGQFAALFCLPDGSAFRTRFVPSVELACEDADRFKQMMSNALLN